MLVAFVGLGGLGAAGYFVSQPQDMSDIEGRGQEAVGRSSRNLEGVLSKALKGGYELNLTEEDINLYLRDTLEMKQGGFLGEWVKLEDVAVRLEKDRAEVIQVRSIQGHEMTISMYVKILQTEEPNGTILTEISCNGGAFHKDLPRPLVGGRFGKLPVPQGFLHLVLPSFENLAAVYRDAESKKPTKEVDYIEEMVRIRMEEGKLVLDSRANTVEMPGGF